MTNRFVLLRHEVPSDFDRPSHWDLLLEREDDCWTWAMETLPTALDESSPHRQVNALRLPNHRKHYLEYEGPVSGDRGTVARILAGSCQWLRADDGDVRVELVSNASRVTMVLEQIDAEKWQVFGP